MKEQSGKPGNKPEKKVKIEVDTKPKHVVPGERLVSQLKAEVDVPAEKELDQLVEGQLVTLVDTSSVTITGGEEFFSHVRRGGSS